MENYVENRIVLEKQELHKALTMKTVVCVEVVQLTKNAW